MALGLAPVVVPELAEPDYGSWRGLPYEEVVKADPESFARWLADPGAAPRGGESHVEAADRVVRWVESLRETPPGELARPDAPSPEPGTSGRSGPGSGGRGWVVVCDVAVVRAVLGHALGVGPLVAARFDIAPLSLTQVSASREGWRIGYVNRKATP